MQVGQQARRTFERVTGLREECGFIVFTAVPEQIFRDLARVDGCAGREFHTVKSEVARMMNWVVRRAKLESEI